MAQLANPFIVEAPRKLTDAELAQAIRQDLAGELEAIIGYEAHARATSNPVAKKVLFDISNEEKEHLGELLTLLQYLEPGEAKFYTHGAEEVADMLKELKIKDDAAKRIMESIIHDAKAKNVKTKSTKAAPKKSIKSVAKKK